MIEYADHYRNETLGNRDADYGEAPKYNAFDFQLHAALLRVINSSSYLANILQSVPINPNFA